MNCGKKRPLWPITTRPDVYKRQFLCNLGNSLDELFSLHRIELAHSCKMLRREGRNSLVCEFFARHTDRISDGEDARVKYTDDIAGVCFINNMTVTRHHLLLSLIHICKIAERSQIDAEQWNL